MVFSNPNYPKILSVFGFFFKVLAHLLSLAFILCCVKTLGGVHMSIALLLMLFSEEKQYYINIMLF